MDLFDFINNYWTILAGIGSFVATIAYLKFSNDEIRKDMSAQKEAHDKDITGLITKHDVLDTKFNEHKDKIGEAMNLIQQDIREIMTILKTSK